MSAAAIKAVAQQGRKTSLDGASGPAAEQETIDARVIALFENTALRTKILRLERLDMASVRNLTQHALKSKAVSSAVPLSHLQIHDRLLKGVSGIALLVSSALFLNNLGDVERFFDISFKTIKARLEGSLDTALSERAMRGARASLMAAELLGGFEAAKSYMHTRNFALGGAMPMNLVKMAGGERVVMNDLQTHADGGPL
jgi:uncharacterized protein (DUF2384 family)